MKEYIYLRKDKAIKGIAEVLGTSQEAIPNYDEYYEGNAVEYYSDNIPAWITYDIDLNTIREATIQELYDRGKYILQENQYLKNGIVKEIPLMPDGLIKGKFNFETDKWEDVATLEDRILNCENLILQKINELKLYQDSGFEGSLKVQNLKQEIEDLKQKYLDLNHELALQIENKVKELI
ncbi:hypothetical protein H5J22_02610 [Cetobacterium sp. 8H]|uniref:hypothetical protein n=1 Tax=Cetobacterium sp. 8H TaxID=2759681 RepID=UPI00163D1FCA|nr:hypothetical protein [Cetobacterium sp. 8H]MBC2850335.1 hypothetical protein [Cetobacterium sp. 8H]